MRPARQCALPVAESSWNREACRQVAFCVDPLAPPSGCGKDVLNIGFGIFKESDSVA